MDPNPNTQPPAPDTAQTEGPDLDALRSERARLAAKREQAAAMIAEAADRATPKELDVTDTAALDAAAAAGLHLTTLRRHAAQLDEEAADLDDRLALAERGEEIRGHRAAAVRHARAAEDARQRYVAGLRNLRDLLLAAGREARALEAEWEGESRAFVGSLRAVAKAGLNPNVVLDGIEGEGVPTEAARDERFRHVRTIVDQTMGGRKTPFDPSFPVSLDLPDLGPLGDTAARALREAKAHDLRAAQHQDWEQERLARNAARDGGREAA